MLRRLILAAGLLAAPVLAQSEAPPAEASGQAAVRTQPKPAPATMPDATQDRHDDAGHRFFEGGPTGM